MNVDRCHRVPKNNCILFYHFILDFSIDLLLIYWVCTDIIKFQKQQKRSLIWFYCAVKKVSFILSIFFWIKMLRNYKKAFLFCFVLMLSVRKIPKCFETSRARFHVSQSSLVLDFLYWSSLMSNLALFILMQIWSAPHGNQSCLQRTLNSALIF